MAKQTFQSELTVNTGFDKSVRADILEVDSYWVKSSEVRISCSTAYIALRFCK